MKKISIILTLSIISIALMSVGFTKNQSNDVDLVYNVDSRFNNTLSESVLHEAQSIVDLIPDHSTRNQVAAYKNVKITLLSDDSKPIEKSNGAMLNERQTDFLKSIKSSDNILVEAVFNIEDMPSDYVLTYYMTVLPAVEAEYERGQDALVEYLKEASRQFVKSIKKENLKPGQFAFTVNKNGQVENVEIESTSGYKEIDQKLMNVVANLPSTWTPAKDANGENVDQRLIFFFGMQGC